MRRITGWDWIFIVTAILVIVVSVASPAKSTPKTSSYDLSAVEDEAPDYVKPSPFTAPPQKSHNRLKADAQ